MKRALIALVLAIVLADLTMPEFPGAFEFDPDDCALAVLRVQGKANDIAPTATALPQCPRTETGARIVHPSSDRGAPAVDRALFALMPRRDLSRTAKTGPSPQPTTEDD